MNRRGRGRPRPGNFGPNRNTDSSTNNSRNNNVPDASRCQGLDNSDYVYNPSSCITPTDADIKDNADTHKENVFKPFENLCDHTLNNEEYLETSKKHACDDIGGIDLQLGADKPRHPSNVGHVDSSSREINEVRELIAQAELAKKLLNPQEVIKKCRSTVMNINEECVSNYINKITKLSDTILNTSDTIKAALENQRSNLEMQFDIYEQCIKGITDDLKTLIKITKIDDVLEKTDEIVSRVESECHRFSRTLPAYCLRNDVNDGLMKGQVTVVSCDSVYYGNVVIPLLLQSMHSSGPILACETNEALASYAAWSCASLTHEKIGPVVCCEVDDENGILPNAKIIYTTIDNLFACSLKDPEFSKYSCIVLNGFSHRSIESDILLWSLRDCLHKRLDMKLVFLVDVEETASKIQNYFSEVKCGVSFVDTAKLIMPVKVIWKNDYCNPDDDFVSEVANICLAIHAINKDGDILALLPSEETALKASGLTASKLVEYSYGDTAACVFLSSKIKGAKVLQNLEQPEGKKRNIIFALNGFESVTFKTVQYVIDSGRSFETHYDSERKLEVQKFSFVSRAQAKMRKNCAGRFTFGSCYRLYSKEVYAKNMVCIERPKLLTVSPLHSMVKIFQYKPVEALTMEFLDPFPKSVREKALTDMISLGALLNGKLTDLGQCIIELPFLPRYSKLIILGGQWGFPFEAVIVVAFFLTKGYLFQYKNTEEQRKKVDAEKLHLNIQNSDTLTFLYVYKQLYEKGVSKASFGDSSIDFNFLKRVHDKVNEICGIVFKNNRGKVINEFKEDFEWSSMQDLIFECFKDNLCIYTGHFLSGYRSVSSQCIVFLHPSCSVPQKDDLPQFIVYDRLISCKSRNIVTHITAVPDSSVKANLNAGLLDVDHHNLFERKLVPRVIDSLGDTVVRCVLKKEKLRDYEKQIKDQTGSELIVIEPSLEKGNVTVYALPDCIDNVEKIMKTIIENNLKNLRDEVETLVLEVKKENSTVPINVSWSSGAAISSIAVGAGLCDTKNRKFNSSSDATAVKSNVITTYFSIHLSWLRRQCEGNGIVGFINPEHFNKARKLAFTSLVKVNGITAQVIVNEKIPKEFLITCPRQLLISGLSPDTTDFDLKEGVQNSLDKNVEISFAEVKRCVPFETSDSDIAEIENELKNSCQKILNGIDVEVQVEKPGNDKVFMNAEIKLANGNHLKQQADALSSELRVGRCPVEASPICYSELYCSVGVLKAMETRIKSTLNEFETYLAKNHIVYPYQEIFKLDASRVDGLTAKLKLSSYSEKIITDLRKMVLNLLEGDCLASNDIKDIQKLFCHGGHIWLESLQKLENVLVIDEYKSQTIRLYGTKDACERATDHIRKFLSNAEKETVKTVYLSQENGSRVLLKAIIQTYGVTLEDLIKTCNLRSAILHLRACKLTLHGSTEAIQKAEDELDNLVDNSSSESVSLLQPNEVNCPVCFCPALSLTFRLENCGHTYCDVCIKGLLADVEIPLKKCCAEDCGKEIILEDIRKVLCQNKEKINELLSQSLKDHIKRNPNLVYCPSPDCSMFVDITQHKGKEWNCPLCHNDICLKCNVVFHHGYDCEMYQGMKINSDHQFLEYQKKNKNCKQCPNCKTAIEKTEGCNHMTCVTCKGHFCWLCNKAFRTGNDVYNHLPYCPRNQG